MTDHFGRLGSSLKGAVENYNKTVASFEGRVLVSARKFRELKVSHTTEIEGANSVDVTPRSLAELASDFTDKNEKLPGSPTPESK
jgi:DNA recombination protein RmuC